MEKINIIWPERQTVSSITIRGWYADAVANGEIDDEIIPDCEENSYMMALALHNIGKITLSRT